MDNPDSTPQNKASRGPVRILLAYLLASTALTCYLVLSLWSAQSGVRAGAVPVPPQCSAGVASLTGLNPGEVSAGSSSDVLLVGCGFAASTQARINGTQHSLLLVDASHIRLNLGATDVPAAGAVVLTLSDHGVDFGSTVITVGPPSVSWRPFGWEIEHLNQEVQLLLIALLTGAFGSSVYALKSMADYLGVKKFDPSWSAYYVIQPLEGAGAAFILYHVVRAGFLMGTAGDVRSVNPFGVSAIAGLAGAFSDIAFLKLREVFLALFKPQDDRGGKISFNIQTSSLPDGKVGEAYQATLQATGGTPPLRWSINPALPPGLVLDQKTGIISGNPAAASGKQTYKVTVIESGKLALTANAEVSLEIK